MDRIMPIDLQRTEIKKSIRGYDTREVDDLLERAASSLALALEEATALRAQLNEAEGLLSRYRSEESLMKEALLLAQKTADETRASAHKEAEIIRESARQQATESVQDLRRKADDLRWEVEKLRFDRARFADEFRALLERYQREIASVPATLAVVDREPTQSLG